MRSEEAELESSAKITRRKEEHTRLATSNAALSRRTAGWDDVHLVPSSLPETSREQIELDTGLLGHRLAAPVVIAGMTGGHPAAAELNATLGAAAERLGLAVGVGSQRAALRDQALAPTYAAVRKLAPTALVIANVGACQLVDQHDEAALDHADLERAVEMVDAGALAIHLNALEETIQPEGDGCFTGIEAALANAARVVSVPVIAKETGAGLSRESALRLAACGATALDVGGAGGTSFARIEGARAEQAGDNRHASLGRTFADWGLPTAVSLIDARAASLPLIATGGIRNGLDAAKALALGADAVGVGRLALRAAERGLEALIDELEALIDELRVAMLLCGVRRVADLRRTPPVLTGFVAEWARSRSVGKERYSADAGAVESRREQEQE